MKQKIGQKQSFVPDWSESIHLKKNYLKGSFSQLPAPPASPTNCPNWDYSLNNASLLNAIQNHGFHKWGWEFPHTIKETYANNYIYYLK